MIGGAVQAFGGLDILHNNAFGQPALPAGRSRLALIGDIDETVWAHAISSGSPASSAPRSAPSRNCSSAEAGPS